MFISFDTGIVKHGAHSSRPKWITICNGYATRGEFLVGGTRIGDLFWLLDHCQWVLKNVGIYLFSHIFFNCFILFLLNIYSERSYTVTESEINF